VRAPSQSCKAVLSDYARYAIAGETYPGIITQTDSEVEGVLYLNLHPDDIERLDTFEGTEYRRIAVQVRLADGTHVDAQTYLFTAAHRLVDSAWNVDAFDVQRFVIAHCENP